MMRKCPSCSAYTFKETCAKCNVKTVSPEPPRFSPQDKYGEYRRRTMMQDDHKDS